MTVAAKQQRPSGHRVLLRYENHLLGPASHDCRRGKRGLSKLVPAGFEPAFTDETTEWRPNTQPPPTELAGVLPGELRPALPPFTSLAAVTEVDGPSSGQPPRGSVDLK